MSRNFVSDVNDIDLRANRKDYGFHAGDEMILSAVIGQERDCGDSYGGQVTRLAKNESSVNETNAGCVAPASCRH